MNKEILNALNELGHKLKPSEGSYKNKSIESFKIDLSNNYRELKQLLQAEERDFPEDFKYENGNYEHKCTSCGQKFIGHKRRFICKECNSKKPESAWEMFGRLIVQVDNVQFADELFEELGLNTWEFVDEQEAIKIIQEREKELKK